MGLFDSALILDDSMCDTNKDSYPLPRIQEALESMAWSCTFLHYGLQKWILAGSVWPAAESQQYTTFTVGNLGFL